MSISIYAIEGTISPQRQPLSCGVEAQALFAPPEINIIETELPPLGEVQAVFEKFFPPNVSNPFCWKLRILGKILTSPTFLSASFIPSDPSKNHVLFVQKLDQRKEITGFFAPYLGEADREELKASPIFEKNFHVKDASQIPQTLLGFARETINEVSAIVSDFLHDEQTLMLGLTLFNNEKPVSIGWIKV